MAFNPENAHRDRPGFSKDYGIDPHNPEGMLPWEWVRSRLIQSRNYWLATTKKNGNPHVAPLWGVYLNENLYFGTAKRSQKFQNLLANPSFAVHLESGDETVIVEGKIGIIEDKSIKAEIAKAYSQKYEGYNPSPDFDPNTVIFRVLPEIVFAWTEKDFIKSATRWKFK